MYRKLISFIGLVLILGLSGTLEGTTYYVSPSGDDGNPGTSPEEAWATIGKVNNVVFADGDSVLFEAGQTFSGSLFFDANDGGTASNPLTIGSYGIGGDGRATISSGLTDGLYMYNRAGTDIQDLIFVGGGRLEKVSFSGINIWTDLPGDVKLERIYIDNVDVSEYHERGISIGGWNNLSGFKDVQITNSDIHDNADMGVFIWGYMYPVSGWSNEDVYIAHCKAYNNSGIPNIQSNTGSGIVVSGTDGALIEFCETYNNGWLNKSRGEGPVGIWPYDANNVVIQFCESHHNKTLGADGGGFDIDGGCVNCVLQYNYSHDNYGAGYLICQYQDAREYKDNVVRYNISANDGIGAVKDMGALMFWSSGSSGGIRDTEIYNNTFYCGPDAMGEPIKSFSAADTIFNTRIHNNIIVKNTPSIDYVIRLRNATSATYTFQNNCYWCCGDPIVYRWTGEMYYSIEEFRAATGQEMLDGQPVGYETDPLLVNQGGSSDIDYKLQETSPLRNAGFDLPSLFGIDVGPQDYFGTGIPQEGAYEIGAHEYTGGTPDTTPPSPDPMTFASLPAATGHSSIEMTATTATDSSGVEYYFMCVSGGGNDSIWQDETYYEDTGLNPETQYCYTVKARDKSPAQNETAASGSECATTDQEPPPDTTPPSPDPMTFASLPAATGSSSIEMTATTATDESGVEYYFTCTSGGGNDSIWQDETYYEDTGLNPETQYCYTVKARDKSVNQNETAASGSECATTEPYGGPATLIDDDFEGTLANWNTDWDLVTTYYVSGSHSVECSSEDNDLISIDLDTSGALNIAITFKYRVGGIDDNDNIVVQYYNGTDYITIDEIGDDAEDTWLTYSDTITDSQYFKSNFRLKIEGSAIDPAEYLWIDDVLITME